jgi:hypothetical protein
MALGKEVALNVDGAPTVAPIATSVVLPDSTPRR